MKELLNIQSKLIAPKNQHNNFGNFDYRSAEDILEAVKPLLLENECTLVLNDMVFCVGERYYIQATATLKNKDGGEESASAIARESLDKKGMDDAQITGSTSSYARKYALNGLFAIDDNKDPDGKNNGKKKDDDKTPPKSPVREKMTPKQNKAVYAIASAKGWLEEDGMIHIPDHKPFKGGNLSKQEAMRFIDTYGEKKGA